MEVSTEIAAKYRIQLDAMNSLHDAVVGMLSADPWTIQKKRGLSRHVLETMIGLLTKASKTFRAIQILCECGLHEDANALVRVLMETTVAIIFILQKKSRERTLIYHAHGSAANIKMLDDWKNTPGLKRKATKAMQKQANDALAVYMKWLPRGTKFKRHWSGMANFQDAVKAVHWERMYASLYRFTSSIIHASDFGGHFEVDPASDDLLWEIEPRVQGFQTTSIAARELLWHAANRIDQRLGLGYAAILAPHKPTRLDIQ